MRAMKTLLIFGWICLVHSQEQDTGCRAGWFGSSCQYKCHCDSTCVKDGSCTPGSHCQPGWFGPACQFADLAYNATVRNGSRTSSISNSSVTDGRDDTCNKNTYGNTLTLTLDQKYLFTWLRVITNNVASLPSLTVQFSSGSDSAYLNVTCNRNVTANSTSMDMFCNLREPVGYVNLTGEAVKSLCSLYISEVCPEGTFGKDCKSVCSQFCWHVPEGRSACDPISGTCVFGCKFGYTSSWCNQTCPTGSHGWDCRTNCSQFCVHNEYNIPECNHVTGSCKCQTGYNPPKCNTSCTDGTFGQDCSSNCSQFCVRENNRSIAECDHVTGSCDCQIGYKPPKCDTVCPAGRYGLGCSSTCSQFCVHTDKNITECDHVTGTCLCQVGYKPPSCDTSCPAGTFGQDCRSKCSQYCVGNNNNNIPECDRVTGRCECQTGFEPPTCDRICPPGTFGQSCKSTCSAHCVQDSNETCHHINESCECQSGYAAPLSQVDSSPASVGATAGAVFGAIIAAVVVAVLGFLVWHRRKSNLTQHDADGRNGELSLMNKSCRKRCFRTETKKLGKKIQKEPRSKRTDKIAASDPNDSIYYNMQPELSSTIIQLKDLEQFLAAHNSSFYQTQFSTIPINTGATTTVAQRPDNRNKNRYKNVCAYDHSRVRLMNRESNTKSDYINASYIQGYNGENFIASQGPTRTTLEDFVRMLWEQQTEEVVMLTNLIEQGKDKCERYWPEDGEMKVGEITVKLTTSHVFADYVIRRLQLAKAGKPDHMVTHFHFTAWPDRDVPVTPWGLVDFEQRVASYPTNKPIVVHCSAGVGRTGTFIALRNVMRQAEDKGYLDIFTTVQKLRHDRISMVQTATQYQFLHRAAQVAMLCMGTTVTSGDIENRINYLEKVTDSGLTNMGNEFKIICNLSHNEDIEKDEDETAVDAPSGYENSQKAMNKHKNRVNNILPKALYAPILHCETDYLGDYINAVFVPSFSKQDQQFLTQLPLPTTVTDFWRLITQYNVSLIVSFEDDLKATDQTIGEYLPSNDMQAVIFSLFELEYQTVNTSKLWQQRKVTVTTEYKSSKLSTSADLREEHILTHLKYKSLNLDAEYLLAVITQIRSFNRRSESRTVYMCRNGADYSGLACVLSLLLDRMDHDGCSTVPLVVGAIKAIRPQVIPTLAQYRLLYQVLRLYSDRNNVYINLTCKK